MNQPLRILIAPDSLKSTATAKEAAQYLSEGVRNACSVAGLASSQVEIDMLPLADGGEGTASLFGATAYTLPTTDANGRLIEATYFYDAATATAYIDIAAASGLPLVQELKPTTADTYGTGVLIAAAQAQGAQEIVLSLGGSATTDGGSGILVALGAQLRNERGVSLSPGGVALQNLATIDTTLLNFAVTGLRWRLLTDVSNPALGDQGAAQIFGPQKGAAPEQCAELDRGLARLVEVTGVDASIAGLGAAGGCAIAIHWLHSLAGGAGSLQMESGAEAILAAHNGQQRIEQADCILTAEGGLDATSFGGKVVGTLCAQRPATTPLWVAAGSIDAILELPEQVYGVELPHADIATQLRTAGYQACTQFLAQALKE